jgi:hypothetical protein
VRSGPAVAAMLLATLLVAFTGGATLAASAATSRPCSDPCIQAAIVDFRECTLAAKGTFQDALDGCLARDRTCVDACRSQREDCRDGTGAAAGFAECALALDAEKERCRRTFPLGSKRREDCIDRAEVEAFRCRKGVRARTLRSLADCHRAFDQCAGGCLPGEPAGGTESCRAEAKAASKAALASCRQDLRVTASACVDRDVTCIQDCADARTLCSAPTQSALEAAVAACIAQERADLAACQAASPGGGPALQQCVETAQANGFTCRNDALDAAAPGFAACAAQYVPCVRACPKGG